MGSAHASRCSGNVDWSKYICGNRQHAGYDEPKTLCRDCVQEAKQKTSQYNDALENIRVVGGIFLVILMGIIQLIFWGVLLLLMYGVVVIIFRFAFGVELPNPFNLI